MCESATDAGRAFRFWLLVIGVRRTLRERSAAGALAIVFPLAADSVRFTSGFGDPRAGGRTHHGQDMFCAKWTPILAVVNGTVDWIASGAAEEREELFDPAARR